MAARSSPPYPPLNALLVWSRCRQSFVLDLPETHLPKAFFRLWLVP